MREVNRRSIQLVAALTLIAYALHFSWEMAQAKWFTTMSELPFWTATAWCARAAGWDVAISAFAYTAAALTARSWRWMRGRSLLPFAVYLVSGLAVTVAIEWWALSSGRWRYAPAMPTVFGVGLSPLLQWIIVPLLLIAVVRVAPSTSDSIDP